MSKKLNNQSGQASRTLIILAVVALAGILLVYFSIQFAQNRALRKQVAEEEENKVPEPVYEVTLGEVRFLLESAKDVGNVIDASLARSSYTQDLVTTEKFIKVTMRAQNKGKSNIGQFSWSLGNIVDSEGRNFLSIDDKAFYFLPKPNSCGAVLKPEFEPVPCVSFYEVSKASTDLKIEVFATPQNGKKQSGFIDLKITK